MYLSRYSYQYRHSRSLELYTPRYVPLWLHKNQGSRICKSPIESSSFIEFSKASIIRDMRIEITILLDVKLKHLALVVKTLDLSYDHAYYRTWANCFIRFT